MLRYVVIITKTVHKLLSKLPDKVSTSLENKMLELENNPRPVGCKKLKGRNGYRIRSGNYRIIYEIDDKIITVTVIDVGDRKDVYK